MKQTSRKVLSFVSTILLTTSLLAASPLVASQIDKDFSDSIEEVKLGMLVKLALLQQLGTTALAIDVDIDQNRVALSGKVKEQANKKLAQQTALSVDGVSDVDNQIEVVTSESTDSPVSDQLAKAEEEVRDAILETKVKSKLLAEIGKHALAVNVEATDGMVILRGELPSESQVEMALAAANELEGVDEVRNLLKVAA